MLSTIILPGIVRSLHIPYSYLYFSSGPLLSGDILVLDKKNLILQFTESPIILMDS